MNKISAIVVLKDNPPHTLEAIASIDNLADEIVIGDIGLDSALKKELTKNKKVRVIDIPGKVAIIEEIKESLKREAKNDYILYHDSDELFPANTVSFIKENLESYAFFSFPRKNIIFGKWISHSRWWPDPQIRLFKKEAIRWPKKLHSPPLTEGNGYSFEDKAENAIIHYNYDNLDQFLEKAQRYAKAEAQEYIDSKYDFTLSEAIKKSISEFVSRFLAFEGYRDGIHGFILAIMQMFYYFLVYSYYWEKRNYFSVNEEELFNGTRQFFTTGLQETNHWMIKKNKSKISKLALKLQNKLLSK